MIPLTEAFCMKLIKKKNLSLGLVFLFFSFEGFAGLKCPPPLKKDLATPQLNFTGSNFTDSSLAGLKNSPSLSKQKTFLQEASSIECKSGVTVEPGDKKSPIIDKNYLAYQSSLAYLKAEASFLEGKTDMALQYLKTAQVFSTESSHLLERKADFYKKEGLCAEAIQNYKRIGQKPRVQKKIIECYAFNDLNALAIELSENLLQESPQDFLLWFQKSLLLIGQHQWEKALETYKHLLSLDLSLGEKAQTLAFQSYAFLLSSQPEEALKSFQQILALDFPPEPIVLRIAELYNKSGKTDWAMSYLSEFQTKKAITKYNSDFLFDLFFAEGKFEEAFQQTKHLEDLGKLKKQHRFYRAFYLGELQQHDRAIPYLKDLLMEDSKNGQYQYMLAFSYAQKGEIKEALLNYEKVSPQSSYFLLARLELAKLLQKEGEFNKSLSVLKKLAFGERIRPFAVSEYAKSLWHLGERKQALFILTSALKQAPADTELLNLKANYSEKLKLVESVL